MSDSAAAAAAPVPELGASVSVGKDGHAATSEPAEPAVQFQR